MRDWNLKRTYHPGDPGGGSAGEPANPKADPKTEPKAEPKEGAADDPRLAEARQESIKERKNRQALEEKLKNFEAGDKAFKDGLLKLLGKGETDDPAQAAENAVRERDGYKAKAETAFIRSAVIAEAVKQGAVDPDAVAALIGRTGLKIDLETEAVEGASEAVAALLKNKPYLVKVQVPPPGGGARPSSDPNPKGASQEEYDKLKNLAAAGDPRSRMELAQRLSEFRKSGIKV